MQTEYSLITSNEDILKEAHKFYSQLFAKDNDVTLPVNILDDVPQISPHQYRIMAEPITLSELFKALQGMRQISSPGSDGLTVPFYLHFWEEIKHYLLASYNHAFRVGHMSISQRLGLIKLIPKKYRNLLLILNWRPITLLNVDFKILMKLFANRLKMILPDIIHPDQRGFIHGRNLGNGILDLYALLDIVDSEEIDALICTIDIRKAFDSLSWDFVNHVLQLFGFPPEFLTWFDILCTDKTVRVMNNGFWSDNIRVAKGSAQGCPLSPLLFIISIEILATRIRKNDQIEGIQSPPFSKKINLVADDILLAFKNTPEASQETERELLRFATHSGLRVNLDKCTVTRVGKNKKIPLENTILPTFQRVEDHFTYIGIEFYFDVNLLYNRNISPKLDRIITQIRAVPDFNKVLLLGRVQLLKCLYFSQLVYFTAILPLPDAHSIAKLQTMLNDIVWRGRRYKMKLSLAAAHPSKGGIGMIDADSRFKAQKIKIALCGLRWFKLYVSNVKRCQVVKRCQILKHLDYAGGSQKK